MAIMLELNHPHIIKLLDFFEKKDNYYMVVEKVNGENVKHQLSIGTPRCDTVLKVVGSMWCGMLESERANVDGCWSGAKLLGTSIGLKQLGVIIVLSHFFFFQPEGIEDRKTTCF